MIEQPTGLYRWLMRLMPLALLYIAFMIAVRFTSWIEWKPAADFSSSAYYQLALLLCLIIALLVGFLVIKRAPGNVCGPLIVYFCMMIVHPPFDTVTNNYLRAIVQFTNQTFGVIAIVLLLIYFPTGKAAVKGIERITLFISALLFLNSMLWIVAAPSLSDGSLIPNELYIAEFASLAPIAASGFPTILSIMLVSAVASFTIRFRRARQYERQQMRWFLAMGSYLIVLLVGWFTIPRMAGGLESTPGLLLRFAGIGINLVPAIGVGIPILTHRLYDIDVIIRRTLQYAILTGILAVIYFGGIILAQQAFRLITGQSSDLAIVISTLLIAALFTPVRRRVQEVIDRRLYRRKYDAEKMLQRFNTTLRDEVNLDELRQALISVVHDTMQPARLALWVRDAHED